MTTEDHTIAMIKGGAVLVVELFVPRERWTVKGALKPTTAL